MHIPAKMKESPDGPRIQSKGKPLAWNLLWAISNMPALWLQILAELGCLEVILLKLVKAIVNIYLRDSAAI